MNNSPSNNHSKKRPRVIRSDSDEERVAQKRKAVKYISTDESENFLRPMDFASNDEEEEDLDVDVGTVDAEYQAEMVEKHAMLNSSDDEEDEMADVDIDGE